MLGTVLRSRHTCMSRPFCDDSALITILPLRKLRSARGEDTSGQGLAWALPEADPETSSLLGGDPRKHWGRGQW